MKEKKYGMGRKEEINGYISGLVKRQSTDEELEDFSLHKKKGRSQQSS